MWRELLYINIYSINTKVVPTDYAAQVYFVSHDFLNIILDAFVQAFKNLFNGVNSVLKYIHYTKKLYNLELQDKL